MAATDSPLLTVGAQTNLRGRRGGVGPPPPPDGPSPSPAVRPDAVAAVPLPTTTTLATTTLSPDPVSVVNKLDITMPVALVLVDPGQGHDHSTVNGNGTSTSTSTTPSSSTTTTKRPTVTPLSSAQLRPKDWQASLVARTRAMRLERQESLTGVSTDSRLVGVFVPSPEVSDVYALGQEYSNELWPAPTDMQAVVSRINCRMGAVEKVSHLLTNYNLFAITLRLRKSKFEWTVKRRYRDFLKLHSVLKLLQLRRKTGALPSFPAILVRHSDGDHLHMVAGSPDGRQTRGFFGSQNLHHDLEDSPFLEGDADPFTLAEDNVEQITNLPEVTARQRDALGTYLNLLVGTSLSHEAILLVAAFLECSIVSFLDSNAPKPLETFVTKIPGGRVYERHNWSWFPLLSEVMHWFKPHNKKWLVVRSNCIAYFNDLDQNNPHEVLMLDRFFDFKIHPGTSRTVVVQNDYRELTMRAVSKRRTKRIIESLSLLVKSDLCQTHRHLSFAPVRDRQHVKFYVDAQLFFEEVAEAIDNANKTLFIADWWMSPELYLKRPPADNEDYRLDRLLKKKADQGVKIYVLLYKEVEGTLVLGSGYAKNLLRNLSPNIQVLRHPDHLNVGGTLYWAHHEKIVVVDEEVAFIGGLDLCFGRWDTPHHTLRDLPGKEAALEGVTIGGGSGGTGAGGAALATDLDIDDENEHVVRHEDEKLTVAEAQQILRASFPLSARVHHPDAPLIPDDAKSQQSTSNQNMGTAAAHPVWNPFRRISALQTGAQAASSGHPPRDSTDHPHGPEGGNVVSIAATTAAMVAARPLSVTSPVQRPTSTEQSEDTAPLIVDAAGKPKKRHRLQNLLHKKKDDRSRLFFPGKDYSNPFKKDFFKLEQWQEDSVDRQIVPRMPWHDISIRICGQSAADVSYSFIQRWNFCKVEKARRDPSISFILPSVYPRTAEGVPIQSNRKFPATGTCTVQILRSCARWSFGCATTECSIQNAYKESILLAEYFIYIENQFFVSNPFPHGTSNLSWENSVAFALFQRIVRAKEEGRPFRVYIVLPLMPAFEGDVADAMAASLRNVMAAQRRSIDSLRSRLEDEQIDPDDYISFFGLRQWAFFGEETIKTELIYVHDKMMIIDDRIAIVGSANINDRSMLGTRDSEIAAHITDNDLVQSTMAGQPWQAGRSILALRQQLWDEHVALHDPVALQDPVSDHCYVKVWRRFAERNTRIYRDVFHCVPDDSIGNWEEYREFKRAATMPTDAALSHLAKLQGHVVCFPRRFLHKVSLDTASLAPEQVFL